MLQRHDIERLVEIKALYTAFRAHLAPDFFYDGEMHDFWEMVYVINGKVTVSADDKIYTLSANQAIFHKPMEFHRIASFEGEAPDVFIMSFSAGGRLMSSFENGVFSLNVHQQKMIMEIPEFLHRFSEFAVSSDDRTHYSPIFTSRTDTALNTLQTTAAMLERFMLSICMGDISTVDRVLNHRADVYKKALEYMNDNLCETPCVSEIAASCAVSESYLKNTFAEYAGIGIHKYLIKLKISNACEMLKHGMSVAQVAGRLNFSSQNYFSMVFRRETGSSPLSYKRSCKK